MFAIQNCLTIEEIKHFKKSSFPSKHIPHRQEVVSPDAFTIHVHSHWTALLTKIAVGCVIQVPLQLEERGWNLQD